MVIAGVDVGGTFTDLVLVDPATGALRTAKVPTTPDNQAAGVIAAFAAAGVSLDAVATIVHGTTTTTNAMLERKVARVGLITTRGFRDVLELGRRTRPKPYGLTGTFRPLIERELRLEVDERMDAEGDVVRPLDEPGVIDAAHRLRALGCEAVVIHFLHSYANPAHEARAAELVRSVWPNGYVTAGHAVLAEHREYERGVTATVNACVQPVLHRYLERLRAELAARGFARELLVMQGNGGTVAASGAATLAVQTVMSGPASGVIAAATIAGAAGFDRIVTCDMGGTSCDVALVQGGTPQVSSELELEYAMPIRVPLVDVHTIGAGGGSIAFVDEAGLLRVGPQSAGAVPGPICYGRGGSAPTVTDANVVAGRLSAARLLAVDRPVSVEMIRARIAATIGAPLGLDADAAATAMLRVANDRMAGAIRLVSIARGHDPRDFALFAFGGAGPLHAVALARELGIPTVLVPPRPGLTNAIGCAIADLRHDFARMINRPVAALDMDAVRAALDEHVARGEAMLAHEGVALEGVLDLHRADMQFEGQSHVLTIPLPPGALTREALHARFAAAYHARFQVALPEIRPVLVTLHTAVIGRRRPVELGQPGRGAALEAIERRAVWFDGTPIRTPIFRREQLPPQAVIDGPAIVEQADATTVIDPGARARLDDRGNLVITV